MDTETYLAVYRALIVTALVFSTVTWLGYTILAPWNKYSIGRLMWAMLFTIMLVLLVPGLYILMGDIPFRREFSIIAMLLFNTVLLMVGYGIYTKQIRGYLKSKAHIRKINKERIN